MDSAGTAWLASLSCLVDIVLLLLLIWTFHIQYEQPAAFVLKSKPHDLRHGVAMEVYEERQDLEPVRELLGHARIDTTQIYARIRPPQLKRAVSFYEERPTKMLSE